MYDGKPNFVLIGMPFPIPRNTGIGNSELKNQIENHFWTQPSASFRNDFQFDFFVQNFPIPVFLGIGNVPFLWILCKKSVQKKPILNTLNCSELVFSEHFVKLFANCSEKTNSEQFANCSELVFSEHFVRWLKILFSSVSKSWYFLTVNQPNHVFPNI